MYVCMYVWWGHPERQTGVQYVWWMTHHILVYYDLKQRAPSHMTFDLLQCEYCNANYYMNRPCASSATVALECIPVSTWSCLVMSSVMAHFVKDYSLWSAWYCQSRRSKWYCTEVWVVQSPCFARCLSHRYEDACVLSLSLSLSLCLSLEHTAIMYIWYMVHQYRLYVYILYIHLQP